MFKYEEINYKNKLFTFWWLVKLFEAKIFYLISEFSYIIILYIKLNTTLIMYQFNEIKNTKNKEKFEEEKCLSLFISKIVKGKVVTIICLVKKHFNEIQWVKDMNNINQLIIQIK